MVWMKAGLALVLLIVTKTAWAQDARVALPTLALDPASPQSIWTGLYAGSQVFVLSRKGQHAGVGGEVYAGYDREFANNVVLGVQASTGYSPAFFAHGPVKGFNYAATDVKVGYDMGRWEPYLTIGVVLAKPNVRPGGIDLGPEAVNHLFDNAGGSLEAAGRVGVGVNYAVTNNLHVGLSVSVSKGDGFIAP